MGMSEAKSIWVIERGSYSDRDDFPDREWTIEASFGYFTSKEEARAFADAQTARERKLYYDEYRERIDRDLAAYDESVEKYQVLLSGIKAMGFDESYADPARPRGHRPEPLSAEKYFDLLGGRISIYSEQEIQPGGAE